MNFTPRQARTEQTDVRQVFQSQPNASVYTLDRELAIVAAHGTAAPEAHGSPASLVGRHFQDLVPPLLRAETLQYLAAALDGAEVSYEITYANGEIVEVHAIPLPDKDTIVQKIMVVARDITHRRRTEAELLHSERLAHAALDSLSSHIAIVDAHGNILAVNQAWRDFAARNGPPEARLGVGANYFDVCARAAGAGSDEAQSFLAAMHDVLAGTRDEVAIEYPCHSPREQRWFIGRIKRFGGEGPDRLVIAHENITERKLMEMALRERETRYRSLFENNYCIMLLIDPQSGAIFDANQAASAYYGWTRQEFQQKQISEVNTLPPAELQAQMALAASEQRNYFHFRHRRADGSIRDVEVYSGPVWVDDHLLLYSIVHDIGERKRMQEALRHSEAALKRSQAVAHIGHWTWDLLANRVTWSDEMKRIFGLDPETFAGDLNTIIDQAIHPDDAARIRALNETVIVGGELAEAEYRVVWPDGSTHYVRAIPSAQTVDEQGHLQLLAGVVQDITERKHIEIERELLLQQLHDRAEQLAQVMRSAPEGVFLLDNDRRVLMTNPQADAMLAQLAAYDPEQSLLGLGDAALDSLLVAPAAGQWHAMRSGRRFFQVIAQPLESGPVAAGWVMLVRDVTAEQQLLQQMQQQERLAAVGQLAAGIAHDFNNILSVVALYAELLGNSPSLTERERAQVTTIEEQALRATRMIRQILDFSRRSVFERQALDLLPLLKEQQRLLRQTMPENIEIRFWYEPGEYFIHADPARIQQLVMNLAINARDAMPEGGTLAMELARATVHAGDSAAPPGLAPGAWVRLALIDNGAGIAPDHVAHIFEPFFTTKPPGRGTGLGLAQVHGIVAQHGGQIVVASELGVGTTFTTYLPEFMIREPSLPSHAEQPVIVRGHGERVLVIEDDAAVRASLVDLLKLWDYRVEEAVDGEDALAFLASAAAPVDIILSDVVMPRMGGLALVKQLRRSETRTPVILMSGHLLGQEQEALPEKSITAWLAKPLRSAQLAETLARALGNEGGVG